MDFTTVIGVDAKTIGQLRVSHVTWRRFAPVLWDQPMIVFYDAAVLRPMDISEFLQHPQLTFINWPPEGCAYENQRAKMLTGFVHVPPRFVRTRWWLKLDTDAVRLSDAAWIDPGWLVLRRGWSMSCMRPPCRNGWRWRF